MVINVSTSRATAVVKMAVAIACIYLIYKRVSFTYKNNPRGAITIKQGLPKKRVCFATSENQVAIYYNHSHLVYPLRSLAQYANLTDFEQQMKCG